MFSCAVCVVFTAVRSEIDKKKYRAKTTNTHGIYTLHAIRYTHTPLLCCDPRLGTNIIREPRQPPEGWPRLRRKGEKRTSKPYDDLIVPKAGFSRHSAGACCAKSTAVVVVAQVRGWYTTSSPRDRAHHQPSLLLPQQHCCSS